LNSSCSGTRIFSIAEEMALTIYWTYSGVLKDNMSYSTAMFAGLNRFNIDIDIPTPPGG
jgi:hypothetical protein